MNRVIVYRGAVPTSAQEVHTCNTPVQRVLSFYVTTTSTSNRTFTLSIDRNGTETEVLNEVLVYGSTAMKDTFEWIPGLFLLTRQEPATNALGTVGDIVKLVGSATGLEFHLAVEVLDQ